VARVASDVTCAPKTPKDLFRIRPTKGRINEGAFHGRTDHCDDQRTGFERQANDPADHLLRATEKRLQMRVGGIEPSGAKRLRALEDETGKLEKLLAEQMFDNAMLRGINSKSW
jgi:putative transposase